MHSILRDFKMCIFAGRGQFTRGSEADESSRRPLPQWRRGLRRPHQHEPTGVKDHPTAGIFHSIKVNGKCTVLS